LKEKLFHLSLRYPIKQFTQFIFADLFIFLQQHTRVGFPYTIDAQI